MDLAAALTGFNIAIHKMEQAKIMAQECLETIKEAIGGAIEFKDSNGWLNDDGKAALRAYYEAGILAPQAAQLLRISPPGAYRYYTRWNKEKAAE
ncbi:hypothetical protein L2449_18945 [Mesorhizobium muleiense]|uniref:hypothetical protein n=1 Tax=Mesorhizobium muleiense TaxID=1004279 RepID=UPI001F362C29|nr:hypothetical protein [Mesorhizobium muleiense]MCF6118938.1 hypothetical protein [Mesorhizobium muleiense]